MPELADLHAHVFDVETTMKCPIGNSKSNPFWPENEVVLWGRKSLKTGKHYIYHEQATPVPGATFFFVGNNIAFDLWYALRFGFITKDTLASMQIWDTQLAEYLLTGQQHKMASLDELVTKRGGTLKDDRVSVMFKAGKGADEVPRNMLTDYLKADLDNTAIVFWSQYAEAMDKGMLPLIWSQMDARLATIEMIHNGLAIDRTFLAERTKELVKEVEELHELLKTHGPAIYDLPLDATKPNDLSLLLFGGTYKYKVREQVGTFKNGNPQLKWVEKERTLVSPYALGAKAEWKQANGHYSTADGVLEELIAEGAKWPILAQVQEYRDKKKQLSTYFEGIAKLVMPDGLLHHNLNHTITATGRLSSSEPNLQNVTDGRKGDIKKAFVSRWGEDGYIVEADYSQLEMVMLAVLSGDKQLMADIKSGIDMHNALFKSMYGRAMTKDERKKFKRCAFALVYGAGAKGISMQGGISVVDARKFIDTFYARYPGVKDWHTEMAEKVEANRAYFGDKDTATGLPIGKSTLVSEFSGRHYVFREYPLSAEIKLWKKKDVGFSPTEIKNYPVQGGATGDIVPLVLGKLFRVLRNNAQLKDKCLMINTVHDSVMFDVHRDVLWAALRVIKTTMESAPLYIKEQWGVEFPLQLKVGLSYGPNWFDQTEVNEEAMKEAA